MRTNITTETDASGDAVVVSSKQLFGHVLHSILIDGAGLADNSVVTVDLVKFDGETLVANLLTETLTPVGVHTFYPRVLEHQSDGTALATYTLPLLDGLIRVTVASGGDTNTARVILYSVEL